MLIASTSDVQQLVTEFSGAEAYALDTEFHGEGRYYPRLAVIQLAVPGRVAVIDATVVDSRQLQGLFAGPGVAVTHAGGQDLEIVNRACGAHPSRVFDTQIAPGFLGYGSASLATLVREFLGRTMDKSSVLSDWFQRPLSAEQIAYAEADVAHLLELRAVLETRLADLGRLEWANEEWSRGGMIGHAGPGVITQYGHVLRKPVGRIHWAGTETATVSHGTIDGAIRSGERAALEVVEKT